MTGAFEQEHPVGQGGQQKDPPPTERAREIGRDIGHFIRDLRRSAGVSLRQLADRAGVSNPYLSQVERGLRKPSAEVLQQIASALRVSTPVMYLRAGLLDAKDGAAVPAAIAADPDLTVSQKQTLTQIYETFRRENMREEGADEVGGDRSAPGGPAPAGPAPGQPPGPGSPTDHH
jgi:transcriptional regulator with XRE-family HTH domain